MLVVFCPGTTVNRQQSVWWTYSLTMNSTSSGVEDADASVEALEPLLRFNLLDLLECNNPTRRRLASDYGILGMDYLPDDLREEGKNFLFWQQVLNSAPSDRHILQQLVRRPLLYPASFSEESSSFIWRSVLTQMLPFTKQEGP